MRKMIAIESSKELDAKIKIFNRWSAGQPAKKRVLWHDVIMAGISAMMNKTRQGHV